MKLSFTRLSLVMALLALASGPDPARALSIPFAANSGNLSASATVTTSAGQVIVVLNNTLPANSFTTSAQALSDFSFTLSNAPGTTTLTGTASGQLANISSTGTVTNVAGSPTRWLTSTNSGISGNTITLEAIGGGQPSQMIAPSGTSFPNVNQGVQNFNPYVIGTATFTLTGLTGVTASTNVTAATFSFGTGPDTFVPGTVVPEPPSSVMALSALALVGGVGLMWNRRRTTAPA